MKVKSTPHLVSFPESTVQFSPLHCWNNLIPYDLLFHMIEGFFKLLRIYRYIYFSLTQAVRDSIELKRRAIRDSAESS